MLTRLFEDARFGCFSNIHRCISLVEVYRFKQCLDWRFSPIYIFFSLTCFRAFRDAPHSRFRCRHPKLCLLHFFRMLGMPFVKSTHVYFICGSVSIWTVFGLEILAHLYFFSLTCFRAFRDAPHSRFWCRHPKLCLLDFFRMLGLALSHIYTRVFRLWKCIDLNSVWVGDSRPYQLSSLS